MNRMRAGLVVLGFLAACGNGFAKEEPVVGVPCADDTSCSGDFACADIGDGTRLCTTHCSVDTDCGDGGRCVDVGEEGDPRRVCLQDCANDAETCPEGLGCTVYPAEPAAVCR